MTDSRALVRAIDEVAQLLARGDFDAVEAVTKGRRLSAQDLRAAVESYGRKLVVPSSGHFEPSSVVEVAGSDPRRWSVDVELWTAEEGRSDLTLELTLSETANGSLDIEIDDLHVL